MLALSTLAFADAAEFDAALPNLTAFGVHALELAPTKHFGAWSAMTPRALNAFRARLDAHGLPVIALQSIAFGLSLKLFDTDFAPWRAHLNRLIDVAGAFGAPTLVFGAPGQRDPGSIANPLPFAINRLRAMGEVLAQSGLKFALEPVAGARFLPTPGAAQALAQAVAHANIGWQFDAAAWFASNESIEPLLANGMPQHAHLSQPEWRAPDDGPIDLPSVARQLRAAGYAGAFTAEILSGQHDWSRTVPALKSLSRALVA
jgi:D-psicose/D-tagatose/L-ribulose 3-epimerase